MIPQSVKDILSGGEYAELYQTIATILFILVFIGIVWMVISRPKKYYDQAQNAPLEDDNINPLNND